MRTRLRPLLLLALVVLLAAPPAGAHEEREASFPDGSGTVPTYRTTGPALVVCKPDSPARFALLPPDLRARNEALFSQCEYAHIQDAIDAVTEQGTRILVLPGLYEEEPSYAPLEGECAELAGEEPEGGDEGQPGGAGVLTYEQQRACPTVQNTITIFGDSDGDGKCDNALCNLQIEGTGAAPEDVVINGNFEKLNGIRADRADGVYFRNFTIQRFEFNALYVLETDGFVIDRVNARWNDEYGFLTFAVDHGLYKDCTGSGNGDSLIYPGSASDINSDVEGHDVERYAVEIDGCVSHHNALGYSGTAGNSVWSHDTQYIFNATGITTDSIFPGHPGLPQDHAFFSNNVIAHNNVNYFEFVQDGTCDRPFAERGYEHGVVCPVVPAPVGAGLVIAGGNYNRIEGNQIYDNWRTGTFQFWVPAFVREEMDPRLQYDTSHHNRYTGNILGAAPRDLIQPNGIDFWWDDQGEGNCWQDNTAASGEVTHNATVTLPDCDSGGSVFVPGNPVKTTTLAPCAAYNRQDEPDPPGCDFFDTPPMPEGREPAAPTITRLTGANRLLTAIDVSRSTFVDGADAVVLARADAFADALVAAPLAAAVDAPILLTSGDGLDEAVADEVRRLGASRAFVMGGTGALSTAVESQLDAAGVTDVQRIGGSDRFATAARVARLLGGTEAYVATGEGFADALAVSGLAAVQRRPILLTTATSLPDATAEALRDNRVDTVTVVGGTAVVSDAAMDAVGREVDRVERLAGANRYDTAAAVADRALRFVLDPFHVWQTTGRDFPDALVAGPAAAAQDAVLLLMDPDAGTATDEWLAQRGTLTERITRVGALPDAT